MNAKLTLKLDRETIEKAKQFAKQKNTSLSMIVENYFKNLTSRKDTTEQITPLVRSLSGILDIPVVYMHKKEYKEYLVSKYKS